ncbi:endocuticle structural protein SgAbd-6-like [Chelonus insularis]|uniref:endocuticle structural protein SgAbd-6-like n=1 Tax=Chelonus insularis TaxID=460826 RepID=UPI00158AD4E8|nr:endocuticle structural protein SgAbd-6-like [Chelonus insularis]
MQKAIVILLVLAVAMVAARPQQEVTIVNQEEHNNIGIGGYRFSYEQSDGQKREETAEFLNEGTENEIMKVVGSFSFVGADGKTYRVDYTADENGFQPKVSLA